MTFVGRIVGQRVYVGRQARRRGSIDARDVVVDASLFGTGLDALLDQVNKVGWAEFAQSLETVSSSIYSQANVVVFNDPGAVSDTLGTQGRSREANSLWHRRCDHPASVSFAIGLESAVDIVHKGRAQVRNDRRPERQGEFNEPSWALVSKTMLTDSTVHSVFHARLPRPLGREIRVVASSSKPRVWSMHNLSMLNGFSLSQRFITTTDATLSYDDRSGILEPKAVALLTCPDLPL